MEKFKGYTKKDYIKEFDLYGYMDSHERVDVTEYLVQKDFQPGEEKRMIEIATQLEKLEKLQKRMKESLPLNWKEEYKYVYHNQINKPFALLEKQLISEMEDYCEIDEQKYEEEVSFQEEYDNWEREEYRKEIQNRY